jgi:tetratricopeptide (TPR) repeat protein
MLLGYVVIASVDFPLERFEHQILFFLTLSVTLAKYVHPTRVFPSSHSVIFTRVVLVFLFIISSISLVVGYYRYNGEYFVKRVYSAHRLNNWRSIIKDVELSENAFFKVDPMSIPLSWYKGVALFSLGKLEDAKVSFERAYNISPNNIHVLNNLAGLLEKTGDHQGAISYYQRALNISPSFDEARLNLSAVYFNMKDYTQSFKTISLCSKDCSDPKYNKFLLPILMSYGNEIVRARLNEDLNASWIVLSKKPDTLMEMYLRFSNTNKPFEDSLLLYLRTQKTF